MNRIGVISWIDGQVPEVGLVLHRRTALMRIDKVFVTLG